LPPPARVPAPLAGREGASQGGGISLVETVLWEARQDAS